MRGYWVKIVLGALAIFGVGYLGVSVVRKQVNRVRAFSQSSDPISIPLAFLPFELDGERAGTFSGIRIMRDAPKTVSAFHIRVKLGDSVDVEHLKTCRLYLEQPGGDFDPDDEFACLAPDASGSGLVAFGDVTFTAGEGVEFTVPLLLSAEAVKDLRSHSDPEEDAARAVAEGEAAAAQAEADRIRVEVQREVERATTQVGRDARRAAAEARRRAATAPKPPSPPQ